MAEEETNEPSAADALLNEKEGRGGGAKKLMRLALPVGVAVLSVVAGNLVSRLSSADAADGRTAPQDTSPPPSASEDAEYVYFDLEPITVNLNEPRQARYIRATLSLAIRKEDHGDASKKIKKRMPELKSWLILYLADCSLSEVRGAKNLARILRDILDSFNDKLCPDSRPLIVRVDYKEWAVQ